MAALDSDRSHVSAGVTTDYRAVKETMNKKLDTALKRTSHVPYIVLSSKGSIQRMAVWTDIKEVLFFWCVNAKCNIVLNELKRKFNYPASEKYLKPCTQSEQLQFLRQFIIVAPGTLLVDIGCLQNRQALMEIYDAVKVAHNRSNDPHAAVCNVQQERELNLLHYSFPMPANMMISKTFLPAVSRHTVSKHSTARCTATPSNENVSKEAGDDKNITVTRNKNQKAWTITQSKSKEKLHSQKHAEMGISTVLYGVGHQDSNKALIPLALLKEHFPQAVGLLEEVAQMFILQKSCRDFRSVTLCSHTEGVHLTRLLISNRSYERRWSSLTSLSLLMSWSDFYERIRRDNLRLFLKLKTVSIIVLRIKTAEVLKGNVTAASPQIPPNPQNASDVKVAGTNYLTQEFSTHLDTEKTIVDKAKSVLKKSKKLSKSSSSNSIRTDKSQKHATTGQIIAAKVKSDTTVVSGTSTKNHIEESQMMLNKCESKSNKLSTKCIKQKKMKLPESEGHGNTTKTLIKMNDAQQKTDNNETNNESSLPNGTITVKNKFQSPGREGNNSKSSTVPAQQHDDRREDKLACDAEESVISFSLRNKYVKPAHHSKVKTDNKGTKNSKASKSSGILDKKVHSIKDVAKCTESKKCKLKVSDLNNSAVGETDACKQSHLKAEENKRKSIAECIETKGSTDDRQIYSDDDYVDKKDPKDYRLSVVCTDSQSVNGDGDKMSPIEVYTGNSSVTTWKKLENQSSNNSSVSENPNTMSESLVTTGIEERRHELGELREKELPANSTCSKRMTNIQIPSEGLIESTRIGFKLNCPTKTIASTDMQTHQTTLSDAKKTLNHDSIYYYKDNIAKNIVIEPTESMSRVFPTYFELKPSSNARPLQPSTNEYKFPYPATRTAGICVTSANSCVPYSNAHIQRENMAKSQQEVSKSTCYDISQINEKHTTGPKLPIYQALIDGTHIDKPSAIKASENEGSSVAHIQANLPVKLSLQKGVPATCNKYIQGIMDMYNPDSELLPEKNVLSKANDHHHGAELSIQEKVKLIQDHYGERMKPKCSKGISKPKEIPFQQKVRYFKPNSSIAPAARSNRHLLIPKDNFNERIEAVFSRDAKTSETDIMKHKTIKKSACPKCTDVIDCPNYGSSSSSTPDIYDEYARKKKLKGFRHELPPGTECRLLVNKPGQSVSTVADLSIPKSPNTFDSNGQITEEFDMQEFERKYNGANMNKMYQDCVLCQSNVVLEDGVYLDNQCEPSDTEIDKQFQLNNIQLNSKEQTGFHQSNEEQQICTIVESFTLADESKDGNTCREGRSTKEIDSSSASFSSSDSTLPRPEHSSSSTCALDFSDEMLPTDSKESLSQPLKKLSLSDKWISFVENSSPHSVLSSESLQNLSAIVHANPGKNLQSHMKESLQKISSSFESRNTIANRTTTACLPRANTFIPMSPTFVQTPSQSDPQLHDVLVPINSPLYYRASGQDFIREVSGHTTVPPHSDYYYLSNPRRPCVRSRPPLVPFYSSSQQQVKLYEQKRYSTSFDKCLKSRQITTDTNFLKDSPTEANYQVYSEITAGFPFSNISQSQRNSTKDEAVKFQNHTECQVDNTIAENYEIGNNWKTTEITSQENNGVLVIPDNSSDSLNKMVTIEHLPEENTFPQTETARSCEDVPVSHTSKNKDFRTTIEEKRAAERMKDGKVNGTTSFSPSDKKGDTIKLVHLKSSNTLTYNNQKSKKQSEVQKNISSWVSNETNNSPLSKPNAPFLSEKVPKRGTRKKLERPKTSKEICSNSITTQQLSVRPKSCTVEMKSSSLKNMTSETNIPTEVCCRTLRQNSNKSDGSVPGCVDQVRKRVERYLTRSSRTANETNLKLVGDAKTVAAKDITNSQECVSSSTGARQQKLRECVETQVSKKLLKKGGRSAKGRKSYKCTNRKNSSVLPTEYCATDGNDKLTNPCVADTISHNSVEHDDSVKESIVNGGTFRPGVEYNHMDTTTDLLNNNFQTSLTIDSRKFVNNNVENKYQLMFGGSAKHCENIWKHKDNDTGLQFETCLIKNVASNADAKSLFKGCPNDVFQSEISCTERLHNHNTNNTHIQDSCVIFPPTETMYEPTIPTRLAADSTMSTGNANIKAKTVKGLNYKIAEMPVLSPVTDTKQFTKPYEPNKNSCVSLQDEPVLMDCYVTDTDDIAVEQNISDDAEITYTITAGDGTSVIISNKHPQFENILQYFQQQQMTPDNVLHSVEDHHPAETTAVGEDTQDQEIITIITECIGSENGELGDADLNTADTFASANINSETVPKNIISDYLYDFQYISQEFNDYSTQEHLLDGDEFGTVEHKHDMCYHLENPEILECPGMKSLEQNSTNLIDCTPEHNIQQNNRCSFISQDDLSASQYQHSPLVDESLLSTNVEKIDGTASTVLDFTDETVCGRQVWVNCTENNYEYDNTYCFETGADNIISDENVSLSPNMCESHATDSVPSFSAIKTNSCSVTQNSSATTKAIEDTNINIRKQPLHVGSISVTPDEGRQLDVDHKDLSACSVKDNQTDVDSAKNGSEIDNNDYDCDDDKDEDYYPDFNTADKDDDDDIYSDVTQIKASNGKSNLIKKKGQRKCLKKKNANKDCNSKTHCSKGKHVVEKINQRGITDYKNDDQHESCIDNNSVDIQKVTDICPVTQSKSAKCTMDELNARRKGNKCCASEDERESFVALSDMYAIREIGTQTDVDSAVHGTETTIKPDYKTYDDTDEGYPNVNTIHKVYDDIDSDVAIVRASLGKYNPIKNKGKKRCVKKKIVTMQEFKSKASSSKGKTIGKKQNNMSRITEGNANSGGKCAEAGKPHIVHSNMYANRDVCTQTDVDSVKHSSDSTDSNEYDCDDDRDEDYLPDLNASDKEEDKDDDNVSNVENVRTSLGKYCPTKRENNAKKCLNEKNLPLKECKAIQCESKKAVCAKCKASSRKHRYTDVTVVDEDIHEQQRKLVQENTRTAMFIDTQQKYLNLILSSTSDTKQALYGDGDGNIEASSYKAIESLPEGVPVYGDRTPLKHGTDTPEEAGVMEEGAGDDSDDDADEGVLIDDVNINCQYQLIDDEDSVNLGGIAYYKNLALPFIYINGYKYTTVRDVLLYFNHCVPGCTIPRKTLQNHKALVKSFSTWDQVYKLELIKMKKGPPIMTGDMLVKLDSLVALLPELITEVIRQHKNTKLKKSKLCKVKLYKMGPLWKKGS